MKPADIILVRGQGFIPEAIERITHSPYSHVAGLIKPNELVEAQGFRRTGYQALDAYKGYSDVYSYDLSDDQRQKIVAFVMDKVGKKYDYGLILWEAEHYILHLNLPFNENGRNDCSTLWADAYRFVGVDPCPGIEFPSPGDWGESKFMRIIESF